MCKTNQQRAADRREVSKRGFTLVEVLAASTFLTLMTIGLVACGLASIRTTQYMRVSTEARNLAKQRMETLTGAGREQLQVATYEALLPQTNTVTLGHPVILRTRLYWHNALGQITVAESNQYAEIHVDVEYYEPYLRRTKTDTFSGIVR